MSNDIVKIPRHGKAGVAFLGVELNDAFILIASIFIALLAGGSLGTGAYIGIPVAGFFLNRLYVDWRSNALPGQFQATLFTLGFRGYSRAFKSRDTVFIGDANVINAGASKAVDDMARALLQQRAD